MKISGGLVILFAANRHIYAFVVMLQNLLITAALFGQAVGTVLAHADAVAGTVGSEGNGVAVDIDGEIG